jgi:hypothetical protein
MKGAVRRLLYIALLLVLSVSSLAVAQTPKPGGTLKVAWEADVTGLDPISLLAFRLGTPSAISSAAW